MARYDDLLPDHKRLVNRLQNEVIHAHCPDGLGHLPNCGIDIPNRVICNCAATGERIKQALVDVVHVELRELDPEYTEYLRLKTKFGDV